MRHSTMVKINLGLFVSMMVGLAMSQTIEDAYRLHDYLLNGSQKYINIRPIIDQSKALEVTINQQVSSIERVDISHGVIEIAGYLQLTWTDETLVWDPIRFGNIQKTSLPTGLYWQPQLTVYNAAEDNWALSSSTFSSNFVYPNGFVGIYHLVNLKTRCHIDTELFPLDSHICKLHLYDSRYLKPELSINVGSKYMTDFRFEENYEWEVIENSSQVLTAVDVSGNLSIAMFETRFHIRRRATFLILHQFVPSGLLLCLNLFTCFVPLNSGERLSYSVTIFLAFVFFMDTVVQGLPTNSLHISVASYSFVIINATNSLTVIWSVITVRLSTLNKDRVRIPWILRTMLRGGIKNNRAASAVDKNQESQDERALTDNQIPRSNTKDMIPSNTDNERWFVKGSDSKLNDERMSMITWLDVATALDKLYFTILLGSIIALGIAAGVTYKSKNGFQ